MSYVVNPFTGDLTPVTELPSGTVVGPGTSTVGDIAVWNDTTGTSLADSGVMISTDGTLAADSDALIPTQKAVKTYVDNVPSGDVQGPGLSVVGDIVTWNDITGTTVADSAVSISTDGTMAANSDALVPTQKAVVTYVGTATSGSITGTTTTHDVIIGTGTNSVGSVGPGSAGQVLQSGGASADPSYSTPTYPSASGSAGKILRADGTNNVYSTATYPDTAGTSGNVLTSDGTNWTSSSASATKLVYLTTTTAAGSAAAAITTGFSADYSTYVIYYKNVSAATTSSTFYMQCSTNGGSTWLSTGYDSRCFTANAGSAYSSSTTNAICGEAAQWSSSNTGSGVVHIHNIGTSANTTYDGNGCYPSVFAGGARGVALFAGAFPTGITINAIRFVMSAGNISGTFSLFGIKES